MRPPIAEQRLALRPDGRTVVTLKTPWRDGTTHLCFEPVTLLERLAALTPRPRSPSPELPARSLTRPSYRT